VITIKVYLFNLKRELHTKKYYLVDNFGKT